VMQAVSGVKSGIRVLECSSGLFMLFIEYYGNNAALRQVRYLSSDI
jgi:ribosome recycling factor